MIDDKITQQPQEAMSLDGAVQPEEMMDYSQSPQLKENLLQGAQKIEEFKNSANVDIKKAKQQTGEAKKKMLMLLFDRMKQMGVDPSNPQSVGAFLKKLDDINPDLRNMFESNFNGLMQSIEGSKLPPGMRTGPEMGDMNMQESPEATNIGDKYKGLIQ